LLPDSAGSSPIQLGQAHNAAAEILDNALLSSADDPAVPS